MAIYESAYDTTACSGYQYAKIKEAIHRAYLLGGLSLTEVETESLGEKIKLIRVEGGNSIVDAINYFGHPVPIALELDSAQGRHVRQLMCVDLRHFGRFDARQQRFEVRNTTEYEWSINRAILNQLWIDGRIDALRDISTVPAATYMSLIAECISRRFALDPSEKMDVMILAGIFYYSLFSDTAFDAEDRNKIAGNIVRITRIPPEKVFKLVNNEAIPIINDMEFFCACVRQFIPNQALENLNKGTLTAVLGGTWFGTNAREVVNVGIEHIPTWIMIVYEALATATYKRTALFKIAETQANRGAGESFTRSVRLLLGHGKQPT